MTNFAKDGYKKCTKCAEEKPVNGFRRREKRGYFYWNSACRKCEALYTRGWYEAHKDDSGFISINRNRAKDYRERNHGACIERQRQRNATPEWKAYMKEYNKREKDRIGYMSKKRNVKYAKKNSDELRDKYIIGLLCDKRDGKVPIPKEIILANPEIIELKRLTCKITRAVRQNKKQHEQR